MGNLVMDTEAIASAAAAGRTRPSATKVERRVTEKNRRNHMKILYSHLHSLIPASHQISSSKEPVSLPDQIDEAIHYIKILESNLQRSKERKEILIGHGRKRSHESSRRRSVDNVCFEKSAQIQIHIDETSSNLEVLLRTGQHNKFMFLDIIRLLTQEQADVVLTNSSASGDSILHLVRADMGKSSMLDFGGTRIIEKLERIVNIGSTSDVEDVILHDPQDQQYPWDFQIQPQIWDF